MIFQFLQGFLADPNVRSIMSVVNDWVPCHEKNGAVQRQQQCRLLKKRQYLIAEGQGKANALLRGTLSDLSCICIICIVWSPPNKYSNFNDPCHIRFDEFSELYRKFSRLLLSCFRHFKICAAWNDTGTGPPFSVQICSVNTPPNNFVHVELEAQLCPLPIWFRPNLKNTCIAFLLMVPFIFSADIFSNP